MSVSKYNRVGNNFNFVINHEANALSVNLKRSYLQKRETVDARYFLALNTANKVNINVVSHCSFVVIMFRCGYCNCLCLLVFCYIHLCKISICK